MMKRLIWRWVMLLTLSFPLAACGGYVDLPEDCFEDELYDPVEQLCYVPLEDDGGDEYYLEDQLIDTFFGLVDSFLTGIEQGTEGYSEEGETTVVTYIVQGNEIVEPENAAVSDELLDYQQDTATHERIWNYYANLIPADQREQIATFVVFTDGPENTLASVQQTLDDPEKWLLAVDIADAGDPEELTYTLIHEFGHLLTLNAEQVPPDADLLYQPDDDALYEQAAAACPRYFPGEGCSAPNAYINAFYERFWTDLYAEWDDINYIEDDDEYYAALDDFYTEYETEFVSDYAVTSPEEDIAESWTNFVLQPKPTDDSIAGQKVLFFYDYPELVKLRAEIMTRTYSRLRRR